MTCHSSSRRLGSIICWNAVHWLGTGLRPSGSEARRKIAEMILDIRVRHGLDPMLYAGIACGLTEGGECHWTESA